MPNLNEIGYDLLKLRGYNVEDNEYPDMLEVAKRLVKQHYALYVRRDSERNGISEDFYQTLKVNVIKVDKSEVDCLPIGCNIKRTKNKIPSPVRTKGDAPFKFVGSIDRGIIYTYIMYEELNFTLYNDFTSNVPRYAYKDGYLYFFNIDSTKYVSIEAMFISTITGDEICNGNGECITDTEEVPISEDILAIITKEILQFIPAHVRSRIT